jgi:hypothetical protein
VGQKDWAVRLWLDVACSLFGTAGPQPLQGHPWCDYKHRLGIISNMASATGRQFVEIVQDWQLFSLLYVEGGSESRIWF